MTGETPGARGPARTLACLAILFAVSAVLVSRVFRGVDFTDESFHAALAYRFVLGDVPFRDELALHQSAALLTVPVVWLFDRVTGGPGGIIVFLRLLFVAYALAVGALVWACLRRHLDDAGAAVAAALFVVAFPSADLNYNTLGSGLVVVSLCLAVLAGPSASRRRFGWSGAAAGFAVVAYPPLAIWLALFAAGLFFLLPRESRAARFSRFAAGAAAVLLPYAALLLAIGPRHVLASIARTNETANKLGGLRKLLSLGYFLVVRFPILPALAPVAAAIAARARPRLAVLRAPACLVALAATCLEFVENGRLRPTSDWPNLLVTLGLLAPVLLLTLEKTPARGKLLALWSGGAGAGCVMAYFTSSNRGNFARCGVILAVAAASWIAARSGAASPRRAARLSAAALAGVLVLFLAATLVQSSRSVYRDLPVADLTHRVPDGPFAGIRTSLRRAELLSRLQADLAAHVGRDDSVIFFDDFPAGFLMSRRRPGVCGAWVFSRPDEIAFRAIYVDCVREMSRKPLSVVRLAVDARDPLLAPVAPPADDPFHRFVARCGETVLARDLYDILRLDPDCEPAGPTGSGVSPSMPASGITMPAAS